jgi:hypothetical protein
LNPISEVRGLVLVLVVVLVLDLLGFCAATKADFPARRGGFAQCHGGISSFSRTKHEQEHEHGFYLDPSKRSERQILPDSTLLRPLENSGDRAKRGI